MTTSPTQKHLARHPHGTRPALVCADGWTVSVQANRYTYCTPRTDEGPWTHVELGYPSVAEPLLAEWAEDPSRLTDIVYGYVPVEIVDAAIAAQGRQP